MNLSLFIAYWIIAYWMFYSFFSVILIKSTLAASSNDCSVSQNSLSTITADRNCKTIFFHIDASNNLDIDMSSKFNDFVFLTILNFTTNQQTIHISSLNLHLTKIKEIILPRDVKITIIDNAIRCDSLKKINFFASLTINYTNLLYNCPEIDHIDIIGDPSGIFRELKKIKAESPFSHIGLIDMQYNINNEFLIQFSKLQTIHCNNSDIDFVFEKFDSQNPKTIIINDQYTIDLNQIYKDCPELYSFRISKDYQGYFKGYSSTNDVVYYFVNNSDSFGSIKIEEKSKKISAFVYQLKENEIISFPGEFQFENLIFKMKIFNISLIDNQYKLNIKNLKFENYENLIIKPNSFHANDFIENINFNGVYLEIFQNAFNGTTMNKVSLPENTISRLPAFNRCNIIEELEIQNTTKIYAAILSLYSPNITRIVGWNEGAFL